MMHSLPDTERILCEFAHDFLHTNYGDSETVSLEALLEQIEKHAALAEADDMVLSDFKPQ
ncbi:MAG: hypothetical protein FWD58_02820 [Firmicutes bacterium]|nr:hypothetical protein [Bacillota bacterium]